MNSRFIEFDYSLFTYLDLFIYLVYWSIDLFCLMDIFILIYLFFYLFIRVISFNSWSMRIWSILLIKFV